MASAASAAVSPSPPPRTPGSRLQTLLIVAGLVAITIAVYAPVRHYDFVQIDDPVQVSENPQVAAGLTWPGVAWAFTSARAGYWMPLVWLSHMLDVQLYGMHAGPHHVTNLALHIACTLLLFGLLLRMTGAAPASAARPIGGAATARPRRSSLEGGASAGGWRGALVAALFAVHPLHVESVAWITERKDVLSTLFWMLTLWAYVSWARRRGWRRYALVVALFALGLMAKPMLVTLPAVMLLLDVWPLGRLRLGGLRAQGSGLKPAQRLGLRALVWEKVPLFALAGAAAVVAFITQHQAGAVSNLQAYPLGLRVGNALVSYVAYIGKMFWPARLAVLYPFPHSIPASSVAGAVLVLAAVSVVVLRALPRRPYLAVGWLWYLVTLLPVIGLVQVGLQGMADRFTYVPLIGLFVMVAWGVPDLFAARSVARRVVVPVVAVLIVLACAWTARAQVACWKDNVALWTHTTELELNLDAYHAHMSLGTTLRGQGRLDEAIGHFSEAVRLKPDSADAHYKLGLTLAAQGRTDEAIRSYWAVLRLKADRADVHMSLALAFTRQHRTAEAIAQFEEVVRLNQGSAEAHNDIGTLLAEQGKLSEALPHFAEAVRLNPDYELAHMNLGLALAKTGKANEALREFGEALRINPHNEAVRRAMQEMTGR